ncbi:MAG: hypothetical protein PHT62_05705 [Desulfotomaculaceae bacterium]|nr:hypothetical protein [Desulfotomaculaceae bacterium]
MSDEDIIKLLDKDIVICGYEDSNLTDIGYNLTPTEFIFSINKGLLLEVHNEENKKYCNVEPNDTVLIMTREAVWVSEKISGTFHSKVGIVSQGFGHISTTLDAHWEGPLLISLNNPTKKRLKFVIGEDNGTGFKYKSFVTLIFYRMVTPTMTGHDNLPCRLDILRDLVSKPKYISYDNYMKLKDVIDTIRDFEDLQVNIGRAPFEQREEKIQQFKAKYQLFTKQIEFHISQAHEINRQILKVHIFLKILSMALLTIPLLTIFYYAYRFSVTNQQGWLTFTGILASIYGPIYVYIVFDRVFIKKG